MVNDWIDERQIMGGLLILALLLGYVWLVWFICKKTPTIWAKALVLLIAVLAVSADAIYGRLKLKQMCEQEGGLKIYETVENVRGFEDKSTSPEDFWIKEYGYQYIEGRGDSFFQDGKSFHLVDRLSVQADGSIVLEKNVQPKSPYQVDFFKNNRVADFSGDYYIFSKRIERKSDKKILASYTHIGYRGGWVEKFVGSIYASKSSVAKCEQLDRFDTGVWRKTVVQVLQTQTR